MSGIDDELKQKAEQEVEKKIESDLGDSQTDGPGQPTDEQQAGVQEQVDDERESRSQVTSRSSRNSS